MATIGASMRTKCGSRSSIKRAIILGATRNFFPRRSHRMAAMSVPLQIEDLKVVITG